MGNNRSDKNRDKAFRKAMGDNLNLHHRKGEARVLSVRGGHFHNPAELFAVAVQESIDHEMRASKCRSIPVGDRKAPQLSKEDLLRFRAVMGMRKHWKTVSRSTFLRDMSRQSKRFLLSEAQCLKVLEILERISREK